MEKDPHHKILNKRIVTVQKEGENKMVMVFHDGSRMTIESTCPHIRFKVTITDPR